MYTRSGLQPGTATIDAQANKMINVKLRSDHKIPIVISICLDAQDKLDLVGYRLVTIIVRIMIEASSRRVEEIDGNRRGVGQRDLLGLDRGHQLAVAILVGVRSSLLVDEHLNIGWLHTKSIGGVFAGELALTKKS